MTISKEARERTKAWIHWVRKNPKNDDQLEMANDLASIVAEHERLLPLLEEAHSDIEEILQHAIHWEYKGPAACARYMDSIRDMASALLAKLKEGMGK